MAALILSAAVSVLRPRGRAGVCHGVGHAAHRCGGALILVGGEHALAALQDGRELVVAETIYVVESFYEVPRARVAEAIRSLLALRSMIVVDRGLLLRAVEVYETARLDFAEAYLVACAESTGILRVASIDRTIDRVGTVSRVEPTAE